MGQTMREYVSARFLHEMLYRAVAAGQGGAYVQAEANHALRLADRVTSRCVLSDAGRMYWERERLDELVNRHWKKVAATAVGPSPALVRLAGSVSRALSEINHACRERCIGCGGNPGALWGTEASEVCPDARPSAVCETLHLEVAAPPIQIQQLDKTAFDRYAKTATLGWLDCFRAGSQTD